MASKTRTDLKCADCGSRLLRLKHCLRCENCRRAHCAGTGAPLRLSDLKASMPRFRFHFDAWPDQPIYIIHGLAVPLVFIVNLVVKDSLQITQAQFMLRLQEATRRVV